MWYKDIMEYDYSIRNDKCDEYGEAWKDFYKLIKNEVRGTRKTICSMTTTMSMEKNENDRN